MRLIDADALIQSLEKKHEHWHELVSSENKEIEYAHQYAVNVIRNAPSAEPTGDLISREDAINAVAIAALDDRDELEAIRALPSAEATGALDDAIAKYVADGLMELPSAEAVQGEWVDIDNYYRLATCSHCHKVTMFEKWGEYTKPYNFCPNCGAKMKGGDSE